MLNQVILLRLFLIILLGLPIVAVLVFCLHSHWRARAVAAGGYVGRRIKQACATIPLPRRKRPFTLWLLRQGSEDNTLYQFFLDDPEIKKRMVTSRDGLRQVEMFDASTGRFLFQTCTVLEGVLHLSRLKPGEKVQMAWSVLESVAPPEVETPWQYLASPVLPSTVPNCARCKE